MARGTDVSGQASVTCRHSLFEAQGIVDLYVGEQ
jgi:hypothetical protein